MPITHQLQDLTLSQAKSLQMSSCEPINLGLKAVSAEVDRQHTSSSDQASIQDDRAACSAPPSVIQSSKSDSLPNMTHTDHGQHQEPDAAAEPEMNGGLPPSAKGSKEPKTLHDWQADAVQYATVEEWFHALVRRHFKGSLKVCTCCLLHLGLADSTQPSNMMLICCKSCLLSIQAKRHDLACQVQSVNQLHFCCLASSWGFSMRHPICCIEMLSSVFDAHASIAASSVAQQWCLCHLFVSAMQPPFNDAARVAAGFGPEWYLPLSSDDLL